MGRRQLVLGGAVFFLRVACMAGEKEAEPVCPAEPWVFKLGVPAWIAGVSGDVGVHGKAVGVDVGAWDILRHVNFTASVNAEARKGRFGVYADFLYLNAQSGTPTPGLVSRVDLHISEILTDFDLNWRLVEGPRGWVDVLIGFRYTNLYDKLGLNPDSGNIQKTSVELVDAASDKVASVLDRALHDVLNGKDPGLPVPPLGEGVKDQLLEAIQRAKQDPELAAAIASGSAARIAAAKKKVEDKISRSLKRRLDSRFPLDKAWFDPYLGLRARYNLTKVFYATAKADIGGFSVGSRFTWEIYGAVGCQLTRYIYSEAGYRYLSVNYRDNGFVYDVGTGGAQVTLGLVF